jgi:hypothetical protein
MGASLRRVLAALTLAGCMSVLATPSLADEYDPHRAGHPLRIAAYILHPIGFALDWLVFRPAHWVVSQPGFSEVFGHDVKDEPAH